MDYPVIDSLISPAGKLDILSKAEIARLLDQGQTGLYQSFRNCALAVLSTGNYLDDGKATEAAPWFLRRPVSVPLQHAGYGIVALLLLAALAA